MKILKPGNVEMRRFVCPRCGCVFVADKNETTRCVRRNTTTGRTPVYAYFAKCPCREEISWDNGEPYEEPAQDKPPERKTPVMDVEIIKAAAFILYFKDCFFKNDDDPCVTFREE